MEIFTFNPRIFFRLLSSCHCHVYRYEQQQYNHNHCWSSNSICLERFVNLTKPEIQQIQTRMVPMVEVPISMMSPDITTYIARLDSNMINEQTVPKSLFDYKHLRIKASRSSEALASLFWVVLTLQII